MKSEQDRPWKHWQPRQWQWKWSRMKTMLTTPMEIEIERKNNGNNCNCNGRNQDKGIEIGKKVNNALFPLQWHGLVVIAIRI